MFRVRIWAPMPGAMRRADFERHSLAFRQLAPSGLMGGNQARQVLGRTGLPVSVLRALWDLADVNEVSSADRVPMHIAMLLPTQGKPGDRTRPVITMDLLSLTFAHSLYASQDGALDAREYSIAMYLIENLKEGGSLPAALDQTLISTVAQGAPPAQDCVLDHDAMHPSRSALDLVGLKLSRFHAQAAGPTQSRLPMLGQQTVRTTATILATLQAARMTILETLRAPPKKTRSSSQPQHSLAPPHHQLPATTHSPAFKTSSEAVATVTVTCIMFLQLRACHCSRLWVLPRRVRALLGRCLQVGRTTSGRSTWSRQGFQAVQARDRRQDLRAAAWSRQMRRNTWATCCRLRLRHSEPDPPRHLKSIPFSVRCVPRRGCSEAHPALCLRGKQSSRCPRLML